MKFAKLGSFVTAAAVGIILTTPVVADADTPNCVTWAEFTSIHKGMRHAKVVQIFDVSPDFTEDGGEIDRAVWIDKDCRYRDSQIRVYYDRIDGVQRAQLWCWDPQHDDSPTECFGSL